MLGDLNIAEPGALIGFTGPRVIEQTIRQKLPEGFQRSEFLLEHGMLDAVVERWREREPAPSDLVTIESDPPGAIRRVTWHPRWVPFADHHDGNLFAVDMAPGPSGLDLHFVHMDADRRVWVFDQVTQQLAQLDRGIGPALPRSDNDHIVLHCAIRLPNVAIAIARGRGGTILLRHKVAALPWVARED